MPLLVDTKIEEVLIKGIPEAPGLEVPNIPYKDTAVTVTLRPMFWEDYSIINKAKMEAENGNGLDATCVLLSHLIVKWEPKKGKARNNISAMELAERSASEVVIICNQVVDDFFLRVHRFNIVREGRVVETSLSA